LISKVLALIFVTSIAHELGPVAWPFAFALNLQGIIWEGKVGSGWNDSLNTAAVLNLFL
jgi:hypothetical protein